MSLSVIKVNPLDLVFDWELDLESPQLSELNESNDIWMKDLLGSQTHSKCTQTNSDSNSVPNSETAIESLIHSDLTVEPLTTDDMKPSTSGTIKNSVSTVCAKRGRGRPPITDPIKKAENKKRSQLTAASNYRNKQKMFSQHMDRQLMKYYKRNTELTEQLDKLLTETNQLLNICKKFENLNAKSLKRLKSSEKVIAKVKQSL